MCLQIVRMLRQVCTELTCDAPLSLSRQPSLQLRMAPNPGIVVGPRMVRSPQLSVMPSPNLGISPQPRQPMQYVGSPQPQVMVGSPQPQPQQAVQYVTLQNASIQQMQRPQMMTMQHPQYQAGPIRWEPMNMPNSPKMSPQPLR